jgi:hypothetical protein
MHQRRKALANGQDMLFKSLRNRVNRERKLSRSKFFDTKVKELKLNPLTLNCGGSLLKPCVVWFHLLAVMIFDIF